MPEFNDINQPQKNLYKGLDTNSVSLPSESSLFTDQNPPGSNLNSPTDWSFATNELLDALPKRWTRGLLYFLIAFVAITLPWGMLSRVDETGTAKGRLEPQGGTIKQRLNLTNPSAALNSQTAKVEILNVKEGDIVKAGDILMELDSLPIRQRITQLQIQLQGQKNRLNVLRQQKNQLETELGTQERLNQSQQLEKLSQLEQSRQNFQFLKTTYNLQEQEKLNQVAQAKQNLEASNTAYNLAEIQLKQALGEVKRYQKLFHQSVVAEVRVIEQQNIANEKRVILKKSQADIKQANLRLIEQNRIYERIVNQGKADIQQAELRLAEQENSLQSLTHSGKIALSKIQEQLKNLNGQTNSLESDLMQTEKEIDSLKLELKKRVVTAQVGGTIFALARVGDVIQQGEMIAEIAPQKANILLKAQMATTESGSLQKGMVVKMKFDAYPFQDYGVVDGRLIKISPTTKVEETSQGRVGIYELEIQLNQTCINTGNRCVPLRYGNTATAEVIVRQRRVIDFILDPFKKLQKGGLEF